MKFPTESEIFANATNQTSINNEKNGKSERILDSSGNGMLRKRIIPPREKVLVDARDPLPVFLLADPAYHVLPLLMK